MKTQSQGPHDFPEDDDARCIRCAVGWSQTIDALFDNRDFIGPDHNIFWLNRVPTKVIMDSREQKKASRTEQRYKRFFG